VREDQWQGVRPLPGHVNRVHHLPVQVGSQVRQSVQPLLQVSQVEPLPGLDQIEQPGLRDTHLPAVGGDTGPAGAGQPFTQVREKALVEQGPHRLDRLAHGDHPANTTHQGARCQLARGVRSADYQIRTRWAGSSQRPSPWRTS